MLSRATPAGPLVTSAFAGYGIALGLVSAAIGIRALLDPWMGGFAPYSTLFGAVALTVWLAGGRPAFAAALGGFLMADYVFVEPRGEVNLTHPSVLPAFIAYMLSSGLIILFGEGMHRANRRVHEADRRKDEFLAALSHELRNPLAPMRTALHILRMHEQGSDRSRTLHEMLHRQVEQMSRLVEDLLDISRITRGAIQLRLEPVAVAPELRAAVDAVRAAFSREERDISFAIEDEALAVMADRVRLQQVVENLVSNAVKFTERGGRIELRARADGDRVEIEVRDDGMGIDAADLERIWELFVQADDSAQRARRGLGIGLALVRDLVTRQGGSVRAHSDGRGRGSVFTIVLPRAPAVAAPAGPAA